VTSMGPGSWLDRLFGAAVSLLLVALALYMAAQLVLSVWHILVVSLVVGLVVTGLTLTVRNRHRYW
jgi:putative effector of murein hydrolase